MELLRFLAAGIAYFPLFTSRAVRMGAHVWLLLATIITELLVILKWSQGQFTEPFPKAVKWGWGIGLTLLTLYPTIQVSGPAYPDHRPLILDKLYSSGYPVSESMFEITRSARQNPRDKLDFSKSRHGHVHIL